MKRFLPIALALGTTLATGTAWAQSSNQAVSQSDQTFLQDQAQGTAYELAIAKLAGQKATAADVKRYAGIIAADHETLNRQLARLAQSKSVALPASMTDKQQADLSRLQGLGGKAFDRAYVAETNRINKDDKEQDQHELSQTTDPAVKSFVQALQKTDAKHFAMGNKLKGS